MFDCSCRIHWLCLAALGAPLVACKPTIHAFRADPNVTCRGTPVRLTWDATSGGEVSAAPAIAGLGSVAKTGALNIAPNQTTRFHFASSNLWGTVSRDADVDVRAVPSEPKAIGASVADPSARCEAGTLSLTVVAPPESWDEHLLAAAIELPAQVARHYHVEHEGKSAELDTGTRSTVFGELPVRGKWLLSTPLQAGEACRQNVPLSLLINVYAGCGLPARAPGGNP